jgi:Fe-S cluster assembly protein SufB
MIHIGEKTRSNILSKGISLGNSKNTYRGLIKVCPTANYSRSFSRCDSFIFKKNSTAHTYPYIDIWNSSAVIEHEATISKMNEDQLFYLAQRGINSNKAIGILISGFCRDVFSMLPMEFALEANELLLFKINEII